MSVRLLRQPGALAMSEADLAQGTRKPYSVFIGSAGSQESVQFVSKLAKALEDPRLTVYSSLLERRLARGEPFLSRKRLLGLTRLGERRLDRTLSWLLDHELVGKITGRVETFYFAT